MSGIALVVVGAGAAGFRCAEAYRRAGGSGRVLLIGDEPELPYDRPELSKSILKGSNAHTSAYLTTAAELAELDVEFLSDARVTHLLPAERAVRVRRAGQESTVSAEGAIVLATGGRARTPPIPGVRLPRVRTLRTMADALSLRSALSGNPRVVVVGAGFIGTEIAAVARAGCDEVTVVDVVDRPLPALPPPVSAALRRLHERAGVRFRLGTSVAELHGTAAVESVELSDGEKLPADLVLIGVGLVPGDELARSAGLACDDGILVGDRFETSAPNIYAVGDVARPRSGFLGMSARHEHWRGAHDGGAALGRFLVTGEQPVSVPPWFWTEQFDAVIHAAGEPRPGDELVVRGDPDADAFTVFTRRGGVWTGVVGVDRPLEVRVAQPILGRDWPLEDALASTETDLRRALRAWTSAGA